MWGVVRDENGQWLKGFGLRIGWCTVVEAELWGIKEGMRLAWDMGHRKVIIEVDNEKAIRLIKNAEKATGNIQNITQVCRSLLNREWDVELKHVFHEQNRVADALARQAIKGDRDLKTFEVPMRSVENLVWGDMAGQIVLRTSTHVRG